MADLILGFVIVVLIGAAIIYIRKEKKRGVRCIGCPSAGVCAHRQKGAATCSCGCQEDAGEKK